MRRFTSSLRASLLTVGVVAMVSLTACDPRPVVEFVVNTTDDLVDAVPGDGVCEASPGAGDCSLRAAVMEANATSEATDVRVVLTADAEYQLTLVDSECGLNEVNDASTDDLDINRSLTVVGNGARISSASTPIDIPGYGAFSCGLRIFENHSGRLDLVNLELAPAGQLWGAGAALYNRSTAVLTDVTASGRAPSGGVVFHNLGDLTLVRSTVLSGGLSVSGGSAVWAGILSRNGTLVLLDSEVRGVSSFTIGRFGSTDFDSIHVASGEALIFQSVIRSSSGLANGGPIGPVAVKGDAIDARGPVRIVRSTVGTDGAGRDVSGGDLVEVSGSILVGGCPAAIVSLGYNSDPDGSCLGDGAATDLVANPTEFERVGGYVTWLPVAGSTVIDAIPAGTPGLCDTSWPTDHRAAPRPTGLGCDIGAMERQPSD